MEPHRPCLTMLWALATGAMLTGCQLSDGGDVPYGPGYYPPPEGPEVIDVAAGCEHTCAVREDGTVHCWGINRHGQLGDGSLEDRELPVQVSGITDAVSLDCGYGHTCAVHASGAVSCWGWNLSGQVGDGSVCGSRNQPVWVTVW